MRVEVVITHPLSGQAGAPQAPGPRAHTPPPSLQPVMHRVPGGVHIWPVKMCSFKDIKKVGVR